MTDEFKKNKLIFDHIFYKLFDIDIVLYLFEITFSIVSICLSVIQIAILPFADGPNI